MERNKGQLVDNRARDRRIRWSVPILLAVFLQGCAMSVARHLPEQPWERDRRLTYDFAVSQLSYHFTKSIAADSAGRVHVVWYDTRDGDPQIYYKRSGNNGATWGPDVRLSNSPAPQEQPAIAVSGVSVYVVWHDSRDGSMDVYFKSSRDAGNTWGPDLQLSHGVGDSMYPAIAVSGAHLHVTFSDDRDGYIGVYYTHSTDGGTAWTPEIRLSDSPKDAWTPSVAASGHAVYAVWTDTRDGNEEEYFKRSLDDGVTWGPDVRLTNDPANSWAPAIDVVGRTVHLTWFDQKGSPIQPRDAEKTLDAALTLLRIPVEPEPEGVVLLVKPKTAKQRIEVKIRKIHAAAPAWIRRGGDGATLRAMMRDFEQMERPSAPFEAEKQLDEAIRLVGLPAQSAPLGAVAGYDLDALRTRMTEKIQMVQEAVPQWVQRSGDVKRLRLKLNAFYRLAGAPFPSVKDREKKIDDAMRLLNLPFVPEEEIARVYYLDAMQERMEKKVHQVLSAAPAWVRRGGDPQRLETMLQDIGQALRKGTSEWQIYYKRSPDQGATWEPDIRLTEPEGSARRPSIAVWGKHVHLVWYDLREASEGVYYRHSSDGGVTWDPEIHLVSIKNDWVQPSVAVSRHVTHVVWVDQRDGNPEVYYKRHLNGRESE